MPSSPAIAINASSVKARSPRKKINRKKTIRIDSHLPAAQSGHRSTNRTLISPFGPLTKAFFRQIGFVLGIPLTVYGSNCA